MLMLYNGSEERNTNHPTCISKMNKRMPGNWQFCCSSISFEFFDPLHTLIFRFADSWLAFSPVVLGREVIEHLGNFWSHLYCSVSGARHRWMRGGPCVDASSEGGDMSSVLSHEANQIKKSEPRQGWPRQGKRVQQQTSLDTCTWYGIMWPSFWAHS